LGDATAGPSQLDQGSRNLEEDPAFVDAVKKIVTAEISNLRAELKGTTSLLKGAEPAFAEERQGSWAETEAVARDNWGEYPMVYLDKYSSWPYGHEKDEALHRG
jgi:hypothetical protein